MMYNGHPSIEHWQAFTMASNNEVTYRQALQGDFTLFLDACLYTFPGALCAKELWGYAYMEIRASWELEE